MNCLPSDIGPGEATSNTKEVMGEPRNMIRRPGGVDAAHRRIPEGGPMSDEDHARRHLTAPRKLQIYFTLPSPS